MARGRGARADQRGRARERESLERRWRPVLEHRPHLEALVTAATGRDEPLHRWLHFRPGFGPGLVRDFLARGGVAGGPLLDPFSGSGTTVLEAALRGHAGVGIEVQPSLCFLTQVAFYRGEVPDLPDLLQRGEESHERKLAESLTHPVHRAALLSAASKALRADGSHKRRSPANIGTLVRAAFHMIREDLAQPPTGRGLVLQGDARRLPLRNGSAGGALTSPPYIARFDYRRIVSPLDKLCRVWRGSHEHRGGSAQLQACRRGRRARPGRATPPVRPAAREAWCRLEEIGRGQAASVCADYFAGLEDSLRAMARVLQLGSPVWIVIGGAFLHEVYVPSDLICAEILEEAGLEIERLEVARNLAHSGGRRLGNLRGVVPRETLIQARKKSS
ncbi:hypothetical protein ACFL59_15520 [Planctomycetota bacterium]